jgi:hypothetical protein
MSDYFDSNNIKYIHSSNVDDMTCDKKNNVAIIGSSESSVQIIAELSKTKKIDWYARSFNNWYIETKEYIENEWFIHLIHPYYQSMRLIYCLYKISLISSNVYLYTSYIKSKIIHFIHYYLIFIIRYINKKPFILNQAFPHHFKYDYKQPARPTICKPLNFNNINYNIISDYSVFTKYDIVICATGYKGDANRYDIYIDNEKQNVDLFFLVNYILPKLPNMIYCLPISFSTFFMLEDISVKIIDIIELNINNTFLITDEEYNNNKNKINNFLIEINTTREQMSYNFRIPTFVYDPKFI